MSRVSLELTFPDDDAFRRWVESWLEDGVVARWEGDIVAIGADGTIGETAETDRFVGVPARHCLNLAAAVYVVLYHRFMQSQPQATIHDILQEERG